MKMVKNLQRSLLLSLISLLLLAAVGCNSNPVSLYDGTDSPLSSSFDPGVTTKKPLDILWVIDNSGSMGEEQYALLESFKDIATAVADSGLDVHMGVTTTSSIGIPDTLVPQDSFKTIPSGTLLTKSYAYITGGSSLVHPDLYDEHPTVAGVNKDLIEKIYDKAWGCAKATEQSKKKPFSSFATLKDFETIGESFPKEAEYKIVAPDGFLATENYIDNSSGKLKTTDYISAFECLTLVGLGGNFIERGLAASYNAVDPKGVNSAVLKKFLRPNAPLLLIIVSDENDCSVKEDFLKKYIHDTTNLPNPGQLSACLARYCDFFNLKGFDETYPGLSPLVSPSDAAKRFIKNLKEVKGEDFDENKIFAFSITGPNRQMVSTIPKSLPETLAKSASQSGITLENNYFFDFVWPTPPISKVAMEVYKAQALASESVCFNPWELKSGSVTVRFPQIIPASRAKIQNTFACYSSFGKATSGDRYLRFLDSFKHRYPEKAKAEPTTSVSESGLICLGDLNDVSRKIRDIIASSDACIPSEALSGCDNNASVGSKCGAGDSGTCQQQPNTTPAKLFCSSYIQVLATATDPTQVNTLKNASECVKDSYGAIAGFPQSCIIKPSEYKFKGCASGVPGVELDFSSSSTLTTNLKGIPLQVRYTSLGNKSN